MRRAEREQIEQLVETLIGLLDADDGDTDLEDGHDAEHDPAEWGVADDGGLDEYGREQWFRWLFEQYRHEKRDKAVRAAVTLRVE